MNEFDYTVAEAEGIAPEATEQFADDAQTAAEATAEQVLNSLLAQGETAESTGDSDHNQEASHDGDKVGNRIRAALASQRAKYAPDIDFAGRVRNIAQGMSDAEIADALTEHLARRMQESDGQRYSMESAKEIIELRSRAKAEPTEDANLKAYSEELTALREQGWTNEELLAFASDADAREDLGKGMTLTQAFTAYVRRGQQKPPERRRGVPTFQQASSTPASAVNPIASMSDEEFDAFDRKVMQAELAGRKVRL